MHYTPSCGIHHETIVNPFLALFIVFICLMFLAAHCFLHNVLQKINFKESFRDEYVVNCTFVFQNIFQVNCCKIKDVYYPTQHNKGSVHSTLLLLKHFILPKFMYKDSFTNSVKSNVYLISLSHQHVYTVIDHFG